MHHRYSASHFFVPRPVAPSSAAPAPLLRAVGDACENPGGADGLALLPLDANRPGEADDLLSLLLLENQPDLVAACPALGSLRVAPSLTDNLLETVHVRIAPQPDAPDAPDAGLFTQGLESFLPVIGLDLLQALAAGFCGVSYGADIPAGRADLPSGAAGAHARLHIVAAARAAFLRLARGG